MCETSVKIILLNEWRYRDAPCEKLWKQEVPLAMLSRILAQSCVTPPYIIQTKGLRMIVLVSLIALLRELLFHYFSHGSSLHRHSFSRMIFTLVYNTRRMLGIFGERERPNYIAKLISFS